MRKAIAVLIAMVFAAGLTLYYGGCSVESPFEPAGRSSDESSLTVSKPKNTYPQSASRTYKYAFSQKDNTYEYQGGSFKTPNKSRFHIARGGLIPPPEIPYGDDVTITMTIQRDPIKKELLFRFGPNGCCFDPSAHVWFDWSDLGCHNAKLYHIDSEGNYIEQPPDAVDMENRRFLLHIDHFSRYAVAFAN